uniref:Uncharacterized protein n=1 Tax=Eubacterium cellulosolvens (strain ATCC 43171 / JCM 9499 / 6) TaxID=633697 RepID=I5AQ47_EUBC6
MKKAAKIIGIVLAVLVAIPLVLLLIDSIRTGLTQDDYSAVYTDPKYQNPVKVADVEVIQQHILADMQSLRCSLHGMGKM